MSAEAEVREPVAGDGYAVGNIDGMGEGYGFRKVRRELDVKELGDGRRFIPGPGGIARVDAATRRKIRNAGSEDAVYVVVGREGRLRRPGRAPARGRGADPRPALARVA